MLLASKLLSFVCNGGSVTINSQPNVVVIFFLVLLCLLLLHSLTRNVWQSLACSPPGLAVSPYRLLLLLLLTFYSFLDCVRDYLNEPVPGKTRTVKPIWIYYIHQVNRVNWRIYCDSLISFRLSPPSPFSIWMQISRKRFKLETWYQLPTNRKWPMADRMMTSSMTSRDCERSRS